MSKERESKGVLEASKGLKAYINESIGKFEVDSLKLRIPFNEVTIINSEIVDKIGIYNAESGEIIEEPKPRNWYRIEKKNKRGEKLYSYKLSIEDIKLDKGRVSKFLCIQLNSKILEKDYLQGLTPGTIEKAYNILINERIVLFSLESFLNAESTDIDFKKDSINKHFVKAIEVLYSMSIPYKKSKQGANIFREKDNRGIEWSNRRTATPTNPFLKLYHKGIQCVSSKDMLPFYNEFLKPGELQGLEQIEDRVRIEYTLKNKKHLKKYGIESHRLKDILSISQDKKNDMLKDIVKYHLEAREPQSIKPKEGLAPMDMILYSTMSDMVQNTIRSKEDIIRKHIEFIEEKGARYRAKKKLNMLYDTYISTRKKAKENEGISSLFNALNW